MKIPLLFGCLSWFSITPLTVAWLGCLLVALFTGRKAGEPIKTSERWLLVLSVLLIIVWGGVVIAMKSGFNVETR